MNLSHVSAGDRPSATQINALIDLVQQKLSGPGVSSDGKYILPQAESTFLDLYELTSGPTQDTDSKEYKATGKLVATRWCTVDVDGHWTADDFMSDSTVPRARRLDTLDDETLWVVCTPRDANQEPTSDGGYVEGDRVLVTTCGGNKVIVGGGGGGISIREIVIVTADVMPGIFNSQPYIHGYFEDDVGMTDLYPNIWMNENLGVLRKAGSTLAGDRAYVTQYGGVWWIISGMFQTRFKAQVGTGADIAPAGSGSVKIWWQNFNAASTSIVDSGITVTATNILTSTVGKSQFVDLEWDVNAGQWLIIGVCDPVFLVDFELYDNLTPGGTAYANRLTFSGGTASRSSDSFIVRDPHSQFRGVGSHVRSAGGCKGKAQWVEDGNDSGYQIIEMQGPAMTIKGTSPSTGTTCNKAATSFTLTSPVMASPIGALYIIGLESGSGTLTVYKDTTFGFGNAANVVADWDAKANSNNGGYVCRPDYSQYSIHWDATNNKWQQSYDGGKTYDDVITAACATAC
jgi:hypothetical protein